MAFDLNEAWGWIQRLVRRVERIESGAMLENSSITNGRMRFIGGLLRVDSGGRVEIVGTLDADGTINFRGPFTATGTTRFEGDTTQVGPFHVSGATDVTGNFTAKGATKLEGPAEVTGTLAVKGAATLENNLTLSGASAKITAGIVSLDNNGTLRSTNALLIVATGLTSVQNNMYVGGTLTAGSSVNVSGALTVTGAKSFRMEHPLDPTMWLQHGSTESPVSGIEYWGDAVLDDDGAATVDLPSYFDALAKPDGRTVFVTGRGFSPDWSDIDGNTFTVAGPPGGRLSWLVKAERFGGDFEAEQAIPAEIPGSTQPPPSM